MGCAAYGHAQRQQQKSASRKAPLSPYGGHEWTAEDIESAYQQYLPWLEEAELNEQKLIPVLADALSDGQVLGLCRGRSEFGPRALGHRSILADPRDGDMVARINQAIKKREGFRPFAPTVLAAEVPFWFEHSAPSPYMSLTVGVRPAQQSKIPAVVHADGTARLQTLAAGDEPFFEELIQAFRERTGVPMLLNTSFNILSEPIVETPVDAAWSFLRAELDLLVLGERLFRRRELPEILPLDGQLTTVAGWSAESVSDAQGETMSLRLMAYGTTFEIDQLQLGILEAVGEGAILGELLEAFAEDWDVPRETCLEAILALHQDCLLALQFNAS